MKPSLILASSLFLAATTAAAAPVWTGDTSNPTNSCFAKGKDKVEIVLAAKGLAPNESKRLEIGVFDECEKLLATIPGEVKADANGAWEGCFEMPSDHFGFYRVIPKVDGAEVLPQVGSRPSGFLVYAVLHDPAERVLPPQGQAFFGIHGWEGKGDEPRWMGARVCHGYGTPSFLNDEKFAEALAGRLAAGENGWLKFGHIDASKRFERFLPEDAREYLRTNKIAKVQAVIWKWFDDEEKMGWFATAMENLARCARERDYGREYGYTNRIYETLWEPELFAPNSETIIKRAKIAYAAIHRGDPDAVVIGPTFCSAEGAAKGSRRYFEMGMADCFDAYSLHAYSRHPPEENDFVMNIRRIKAIAREYMGPDVRFYGTEDGFFAPFSPQNERNQLYCMVRKQLIMLGEGFEFNTPFYGYDHGKGPGISGFAYNLSTPRWTFGPKRVAPHPVFAGLSAASWFLEGHRPTCTIEWLGETALGYAYQSVMDGRCVLALWDWGDNGTTAELPVGCEKVTLADIMGNERELATPGGKLTLKLGLAPQYVIGVSPDIWGKEAQATLKWTERKFRSAAEDAPIKLLSARTSFEGGVPGVVVELEGNSPSNIAGRVETRIYGRPEARQSREVALRHGETVRVAIPFPKFDIDPFEEAEVDVRVEPKSGLAVDGKFKMNFFRVAKSDGFPQENVGFLHVPEHMAMDKRAHLHDGSDDCSVSMRAFWNERHLLLEFAVEDDSFVQTRHGWWTWMGDSIQIGLAKDKFVKDTSNPYAEDVERALSEFTIALTDTGPEADRTMTWDDKLLPLCGGPSSKEFRTIPPEEMPLEISKEELDGGRVRLVYRVSVPWAHLNMENPKPGMNVYLGASVNDLDEGAKGESRLGIFELKNTMPRQFGFLTLAEGCGAK